MNKHEIWMIWMMLVDENDYVDDSRVCVCVYERG